MQILRQDPGLHHVAGFAIAGVQRRNRDDRLAIKRARPFMQHITLGHAAPTTLLAGSHGWP